MDFQEAYFGSIPGTSDNNITLVQLRYPTNMVKLTTFFLQCAHCKNKLVILTIEWLPWLQTNWRDCVYERFTLLFRTNCIRLPNRQLQTSFYINPRQNSSVLICYKTLAIFMYYCNAGFFKISITPQAQATIGLYCTKKISKIK